jgi:hypothetical protein
MWADSLPGEFHLVFSVSHRSACYASFSSYLKALDGVSTCGTLVLVQVANQLIVYMNGQSEKAERVLTKLHLDKKDPNSSYPHDEFMLMKAQIDLEAESASTRNIWSFVKDPHLRKRFIVGILAGCTSQACGAIVILSKYRANGVGSYLPSGGILYMTLTNNF